MNPSCFVVILGYHFIRQGVKIVSISAMRKSLRVYGSRLRHEIIFRPSCMAGFDQRMRDLTAWFQIARTLMGF